MEKNTTPTLADLVALLDPETLETLTARLHCVAATEQEAPEQMLLSFLDESLTAHEEVANEGMSRVEMAEAILDELPEAVVTP